MATATLHSSTAKARPVESLPAYWSSLWRTNASSPAKTPAAPAPVEKSSALVGDLWIQIR